MRTSKVLVFWKNFEKIFDDFDIIQFSYDYAKFQKLGYKKSEFDDAKGRAGKEIKALSVVYKMGGKCLYLFRKNSTEEKEIENYVKEHPYISDYEKIKLFDVRDTQKREKFFLKNDRALLQLLFNSMLMPKGEKYSYNNINGKLLYRIESSNSDFSEEKGFLSFINFHLSSEINLEFPVTTFKKSPYGPYVMDSDLNFRYELSEEDKKLQHYIKESKNGAHNTVTFLDVANIEVAQKTKINAIAQFKKKVQEKLSEYFEIDFEILDSKKFNKQMLQAENQNYDRTHQHSTSFFNKRGVYLVNYASGEDKAELIKQSILENFKKNSLCVNVQLSSEIHEDAFNIVIAHDKDYYIKHKIPEQDPYREAHKYKIVQFVTIESYKPEFNEKSPFFLKILNELEIAGEILDGKLRHVWKAVNQDWTFVYYTVDKKKEEIDFYRVRVGTDDTLKFSHFKYSDLLFNKDLDKEAKTVIDYVCELERKNFDEYFEEGENNGLVHYGEVVEGLCYTDVNNIQTIIRTPFHTLPNFDAIINDLSLSSDTYQVDLVSMRECITKKVNSTFSNDKYKMILDKLDKFGNSVDFKTLKESQIFAHHPRSKNDQWIRNLIDELYTEKGVLVSLEIRSERMDKRYELSNITDIQYFDVQRSVYNSERNIAKEIPSMSYICGHHYKGMQSSLPVGCIIRSVIWQKECQFKEIIKTMAVDFVRNDYYYTVLPFPFKYLREYAKMVLILLKS